MKMTFFACFIAELWMAGVAIHSGDDHGAMLPMMAAIAFAGVIAILPSQKTP